ncbi:hypothetical protein PVK06_025154 [Gossypium arboreum]|uniref:CCHC-type domain-containing protein n=1 Tax=Gossypium arboreum TaxID=29729 RepID=A0ABR0PFW5_GOSAR|nr:hypothetical protein PVK06_025154 [Gossypium arboreum]
MDRQMALDVGNTVGELVAIDWKDRNGVWTKFMRLNVKIEILKPLRRFVKIANKGGVKMIEVIKYKRLLDFCYVCGLIGHTIKKCQNSKAGVGVNDSNLQYRSWMRISIVNPNQERGMRRNGVEIVKTTILSNKDKEESQTNTGDESGSLARKKKRSEAKKTRYRPHLWKKEVKS